jgi:hypothetical protein
MNPLARIKQVLNNRKRTPITGIEGGFIGFPVGKLLFFTRLINRAVAVPEHVSALPGLQSALLGLQSALPGLQSASPGLQSALPGPQSALLRQEVNYKGDKGGDYVITY